MKLKSIRMKSVTPTPAPRSMSPAIRNEIDELKKHAIDSETSKAHFFVNKEIYLDPIFHYYLIFHFIVKTVWKEISKSCGSKSNILLSK